jgi:hypothetical protein
MLNALTVLSLMLCVTVLVLCARRDRTYNRLTVQTVARFSDHPLYPFVVVDENVEYSATVEGGMLILSRVRGTFGRPMIALQSLPHRLGERRWIHQSGPASPVSTLWPKAEHNSFFHQGNVDAVDAWMIPVWMICGIATVLPAT